VINKISSYFPGHAIGLLLIAQYLGSNGQILNTGYNHTLFLQLLVSFISLLFAYTVNREKSIKIMILILLYTLLSVGHYLMVLDINGGEFNIGNLYYYLKFGFYSFVFFLIFFYFKSHNFLTTIKYLKFIVIVLFSELLIYSLFKYLSVPYATLFESVDGRFAGVFLYHNTLVTLFALFVISYALFFDSSRWKYIFLVVGFLLILSSGERSSLIGLLFLITTYILFWSKDTKEFKKRIYALVIIAIFFLFFVVAYTLYFRGMSLESYEMFFRPLIARIYFSYLSIVHVFDQSLFGFGPFSYLLPTNISDMYSQEVSEFVKIIDNLFGSNEAKYINSYHDSGNLTGPSSSINSHNTFLLMFYYFGLVSIFVYTYLAYLIFVYVKYLRLNLKAIKRRITFINNRLLTRFDEKFCLLPIVSVVFLIASIPALFLLSLDNYLLLIVIALGYIGSFLNGKSYA